MIQTEENEKHSMNRYRILIDEPPSRENIKALERHVVSYIKLR
jgi:hypothetical protein